MKRYFLEEPTAAELDELRTLATRRYDHGLFIGPRHFYSFNDLPTELARPIAAEANPDVPSGSSSVADKKAPSSKSRIGQEDVEGGAKQVGRRSRAEIQDAIKKGELVRAFEVEGYGDPDADDDCNDDGESAVEAKPANKKTPAGQAGNVVDAEDASTSKPDSGTAAKVDASLIAFISDACEPEFLNPKTLLDESWIELPLYSEVELKVLDDDLRPRIGGKEADDKLGKRILALVIRGNKRKLMALPVDWSDRLGRLAERFLNFKAVIDYVRTECLVAAISSTRAAKLAPILLAGGPGIGKTAFAMELAAILSGSFHMVAMENSQSGSSIGGSSKFWSNTHTGKVFNALVDNEVINPVFLIDELDKASTDSRFDPVAPLYQLLEQRTAAIFRDESIPELAIDTSHINWILTANDIDRVPAPIRSRLHIFNIPSPTPAQTRTILHHIFGETLAELKATVVKQDYVVILEQMTLSKSVIDALCFGGIRVVKRLLRTATVKALGRRSAVVEFPDIYDLATFEIDPIYMRPH